MVSPFNRLLRALPALLLLFLAAPSVPAGSLAPGVDYETYTLAGPIRVFTVKWDHTRPDIVLEMGFPHGRRNYPSRQTTSTIAQIYNARPGDEVVAAVNASFFGTGIGITGLLATYGNLTAMPDLSRNWPTYAYQNDGTSFIVLNPSLTDNQLRFTDTSSLGIDLLNAVRQTNTMVLYTTDWGPSTTTTAQGVEVILSNVTYPMPANKTMSGTVTAIRTGAESLNNTIPAGGAVISARDAKGTTLASKVSVGDTLTWRIGLGDARYENTRTMVDGFGYILKDGEPFTANWSGASDSFKGKNPRTMVAWNDTHTWLIVIDGRQTGYSTGMTFEEMADFCRNTLGAREAVNLDGGGSSAMIVNGALVNQPSDGTERAVANALMLVRRESLAYAPANTWRVD